MHRVSFSDALQCCFIVELCVLIIHTELDDYLQGDIHMLHCYLITSHSTLTYLANSLKKIMSSAQNDLILVN